ncbi:MAG: phage tail protein [Sphingomonadaceae bacterium]
MDSLAGDRRGRYDLPELRFTSSSYGDPIPQVFGRHRVPGVMIWATQPRRASARKGGTPDRRAYFCSFAVALSSRKIRKVGRIWADGREIRNKAGEFEQPIVMRVYLGTRHQEPDPLIVAEEGLDGAPAYRGLAYVLFENFPLSGFGNRIPSLGFEVWADEDQNESGSWVGAILGQSIAGDEAQHACLPVAGYLASRSARADAALLAEVADARIGRKADRISLSDRAKLVPVPRSELVSHASGPQADADFWTSQNPDRRPAECAVAYADPERDYQAGRQHLAGLAGSRFLQLAAPISATASQALAIAETAASRAVAETEELEIMLSWDWLNIDAGSLLTVEGVEGRWAVVQKEIGRGTVTFRCLRDHGRRGEGRVTDPGRAIIAPARPTPSTRFEIVELPFASALGPAGLVHVFPLAQDGWKGADFAWSDASGDVRPIGWQDAGVPHGEILAPLALGPSTIWDEVNALRISGFWGDEAPLSRAPADLRSDQNLLVVGDEVIQFRDATELADGSFLLRGLLRGRKGSIPRFHAAGTGWYVLDEARGLSLGYAADAVGSVLRFEAVGPGDVSSAASQLHQLSGAALSALAPCHVRLVRDSAGTVHLQWIERNRRSLDWYAPQMDPAGWYRIDLQWTVAGQPMAFLGRVQGSQLQLPAEVQAPILAADPGSTSCTVIADGIGPEELRSTGALALATIE